MLIHNVDRAGEAGLEEPRENYEDAGMDPKSTAVLRVLVE
jgi:hypothetical protein